MRSAERMAELLFEKEFDQVIVKYRGAGETDPPTRLVQQLPSGH